MQTLNVEILLICSLIKQQKSNNIAFLCFNFIQYQLCWLSLILHSLYNAIKCFILFHILRMRINMTLWYISNYYNYLLLYDKTKLKTLYNILFIYTFLIESNQICYFSYNTNICLFLSLNCTLQTIFFYWTSLMTRFKHIDLLLIALERLNSKKFILYHKKCVITAMMMNKI